MTGYKSKKAAALDEDGMYLVHHTKRKDEDDDDAQGYIAQYESALQKEYKRGYDAGKAAALKLALRDLENAEIDGNCEYGSTEIIRKALAQPEPEDCPKP